MQQELNSTVLEPFQSLKEALSSVNSQIKTLQGAFKDSQELVGLNRTVEQGMDCSFLKDDLLNAMGETCIRFAYNQLMAVIFMHYIGILFTLFSLSVAVITI